MENIVKEAVGNLQSAIQSERTDIVCSILSALQHSDEKLISDQLTAVLSEQLPDGIGTLLHFATKTDHTDIIRALLSAGADPGIQNSNRQTPRDLLSSKKATDVFNEELLQAAAHSNVGRVCQLLAAGLDINLVDSVETKNTPLHWAACYGNWEIVQCLCSRGANINAVNSEGATPLHDAVRRGNLRVTEELLLYGADPSIKVINGSDCGRTAYELAAGQSEIVVLLQNPPEIKESEQNGSLSDPDETISSKKGLIMNGPISNGPTTPDLLSPNFHPNAMLDELTRPPKPVITDETLSYLWPQPQVLLQRDDPSRFVIEDKLTVYIAEGPCTNYHEIVRKWELRRPAFLKLGVEIQTEILTQATDLVESHTMCHVNHRLCTGIGSFKLNIMHKQIKLVCDDVNGLNYAIATLLQLVRLYKEEDEIRLPLLQIEDWPEFRLRGVLLDISQGRIHNIDTLTFLIDTLSLLKINQVHLYARIKSGGDPSHWQICYSRSEILKLDNYCIERGVQLIPVLEVCPQVSFDDVHQLYPTFHDYCSCFIHAEYVNIGPRLSSFVFDTSYDEMLIVQEYQKFLPIRSDQTVMLCGYPLCDIDVELLQQLPPQLVFMQYGVQATHDFRAYCGPLCDVGLSFIACPGTAAWNSLAGCPEATVSNIYSAVKCSADQGALGIVTCNWAGKGHLTHEPICWPGFLISAGLSWNSDTHWDYLHSHVGDLISKHVYMDTSCTIGRIIIELGRAETYILRCSRSQSGPDCEKLPDEKGSTLFQFLLNPNEVNVEKLTPDILQKTVRHIKKCQIELPKARLQCAHGAEIISELQLATDLMVCSLKLGRALVSVGRKPGNNVGLGAINPGIVNLSPTTKTDVANKLLELLETLKSIWKSRYLPDGLTECLQNLHGLLRQLVPDSDNSLYTEIASDKDGVDTTS